MRYLPSRKAAEVLGVHPNTLRRWADGGKIDHIRTDSGQRRYDVDSYVGRQSQSVGVCYCRVSSYKQKDDLERQVIYMREQHPTYEVVRDIGSGLNFKRKGLRSLLGRLLQGDKLRIMVAHKDRLARFGFECIQFLVESNGGEIVVLDQSQLSPERELTEDLLAILNVFSCRMHGRRSYKGKEDQIVSDARIEDGLQAMVRCLQACVQQNSGIPPEAWDEGGLEGDL